VYCNERFFVNFKAIWSILLPLGKIYGHLVYFVVILVYFSRFGLLYQDKSGNPDNVNDVDNANVAVTFLNQSSHECWI
jgi:hypothetical protein